MNYTDHNPQAAFKSRKRAAQVFTKPQPMVKVYKPYTIIDVALVAAILVAVGLCGWAMLPTTETFTIPEMTIGFGDISVTTEATAVTVDRVACEEMAASPLVVQLGGVKADSPCGRLLGL